MCVLNEFGLSEIKTKLFFEALSGLDFTNALILTSRDDEILMKSARNVPHVKVLHTNGLNVYDILKYENLIVLEPAMEAIKERLARNEGSA